MKQETYDKITEALHGLHEATHDVPKLSVLTIVAPHGERGQMRVQMLTKGDDTQIAHKLYECMRHDESLPFSLTNIIMTAAAKYLAEQGNEARQAFDRTVEKCRKQWEQAQEVAAVIDDCRQVIDEINSNEQ